jgi:hypothetical protein
VENPAPFPLQHLLNILLLLAVEPVVTMQIRVVAVEPVVIDHLFQVKHLAVVDQQNLLLVLRLERHIQ